MTSDFALDVATYPKVAPNSKIAQYSVRAYYLGPLAMRLVVFVDSLHNTVRHERML